MFIEILLIICGGYILIQSIRMKVTGRVVKGLVSDKVKPSENVDTEGYINYMFPRGVVFGTILAIVGTILLVGGFESVTLPDGVILFAEITYIVSLIYYANISIKAQNRFLFNKKKESKPISSIAGYVNAYEGTEDVNEKSEEERNDK